jgi:hypothetical protein
MFKKKSPKPDDLAARHNDLQARLSAAEDRLTKLRADAVALASSDPDKLANLSSAAYHLEFEINALRAAIEQAEQDIEEANEKARREADKEQRKQTSRELLALADGLEKAVAPVPEALKNLQDAIAAVLPIVGQNGLPDLLGNLCVEIPAAVELFVAEIRARADQTLQGTAPPTLPAPPVLTVIEEPLLTPTISIFSLERLSWLDERGQRQNCGPFEIHGLPVAAAKIAMERGLAISPDSERYKKMREEARKTGWPHLVDAQKIYDLSRDPNTTAVFSSGGRKVREEPGKFEVMDRGPPRQVFVSGPEEQF